MKEKRNLSISEKRQLYCNANGKCEKCFKLLEQGWHAHHILPFSLGGKTHIKNSMALCKECHIKIHKNLKNGVNRIMSNLKLRQWQSDAFDVVTTSNNKVKLIEAAPAAGKTFFAGVCANHYINNTKINNFVIIVSPTINIQENFINEFHNHFKIELNDKVNMSNPLVNYNGVSITYNALCNNDIIETFKIWVNNGCDIMFIFDEIHHSSELNKWGNIFKKCSKISDNIICLTGTPFRSDNIKIPMINYDSEGTCIPDYKYNYSKCVQDNVCREIFFYTGDGSAKYAINGTLYSQELSKTQQNSISHVANTIFDSDQSFFKNFFIEANKKLNEYRKIDKNAGGIIICQPGYDKNDNRKLNKIAKTVYEITGEMPCVVASDIENSNAKINEFRNDSTKWIISIKMISEGVDIKRLKVGLIATNVNSELAFRQFIGRVLRINNLKNEREDATVFIPGFQHMLEMASRIREEAKCGIDSIKEKNEDLDDDDFIDNIDKNNNAMIYQPIESEYKNGIGISSFGDKYEYDDIMKAKDIIEEMDLSVNEADAMKIYSYLKSNFNVNSCNEKNIIEKNDKPIKDVILEKRKKYVNLAGHFTRIMIPHYGKEYNKKRGELKAKLYREVNKKLNADNLEQICNEMNIEDGIEKAIEWVEYYIEKAKNRK